MWSPAEKESDAPKKRRPLLCACSKQDVVDPNPPPAPAESWLTSPSQPPEAIEDKPARRSSLSDAMAVAGENVRMSHAQASKWAGAVSRHTQSFLTAKGWCGSLTVCVGLFAVKIIVSLPVGGNVAIEMHWANLVGSTFDGWGSGDEDAEEKSKVPKALKRLASILVAARKALPMAASTARPSGSPSTSRAGASAWRSRRTSRSRPSTSKRTRSTVSAGSDGRTTPVEAPSHTASLHLRHKKRQ